MRQLPLVMPTKAQEKRLKELAEQAMEAKAARVRWRNAAE